MNEPIVSIASVTYRNLDATRKFVESVYAKTKVPFQFVMVNNGSPAELTAYLNETAQKKPNFQLIHNPANLGIGPAMNAAMRACTTNYIFRCDSDVEILTDDWTTLMCQIVDSNPDVGAVGTAITGGKVIQRQFYFETDIILSNCMLIHKRAVMAIQGKLAKELPRVSEKVADLVKKHENRWEGYFRQIGGIIDEMMYDGGRWSRQFPYGADDFHYSMLIRYAGLRLAKDPRVSVVHLDDSMRPDWQQERHRRVSEGFQYWRAFWEIILDYFQVESLTWDCWPINKTYADEWNKIRNYE